MIGGRPRTGDAAGPSARRRAARRVGARAAGASGGSSWRSWRRRRRATSRDGVHRRRRRVTLEAVVDLPTAKETDQLLCAAGTCSRREVKAAIVRCAPDADHAGRRSTTTLLRCSTKASVSIRSIALEIVLEIQRSFGVEISDEQVGKQVLRSVGPSSSSSSQAGSRQVSGVSPRNYYAAGPLHRAHRASVRGGTPVLSRPGKSRSKAGCDPVLLQWIRSTSNAQRCLTVDVEEWFHVCGAGGPLAFERWDALPSRVVETTRDLLDLFDACGVRGTFFVLGWVAERHPAARGHGSPVRDTRSAPHGHLHRRVYELTPESFAQDLDACRFGPGRGGRRQRARLSCARNGRSMTVRCGRSSRWLALASPSIRAWRRCG